MIDELALVGLVQCVVVLLLEVSVRVIVVLVLQGQQLGHGEVSQIGAVPHQVVKVEIGNDAEEQIVRKELKCGIPGATRSIQRGRVSPC